MCHCCNAARPDPRDPTLWPQRESLKSALQCPALAGPVFDALTVESFTHPGYAAVRIAIEAAGGTSSRASGAQWIEAVREQAATPAVASPLAPATATVLPLSGSRNIGGTRDVGGLNLVVGFGHGESRDQN